MRSTRMMAGCGGVGFGVLFFAAMMVGNPPGGNYSASDIAGYVASGHRVAVFSSVYLAILAVVGLIALLAGLRSSWRPPPPPASSGAAGWPAPPGSRSAGASPPPTRCR